MNTMHGHTAKTIPSTFMAGTWRATCTCGWEGALRGARGARGNASADVWRHLADVEDGILAPA